MVGAYVVVLESCKGMCLIEDILIDIVVQR